jgi:rhamnosyltransferase
MGIAVAQNKICQYAKEHGYKWAITLDQDSVCPTNLVKEYEKIYHDSKIGMICPKVIDRNFGEITYGIDHTGVEEVEQCIASASAIRISAWQVVGGFYEPLFIDSVDFDICWSLREHGYKILRTNDVKLLHEVGHSRVVHFAGKTRQIYNHSPLRYYYMIRNAFITGRRHHRLLRNLRASVRLIYQINRYESNRYEKNKMLIVGFFHGLIGKTGKYGK